MDKKLRETTNYLCTEIMNGTQEVHVVQICICRLM